MQIMPITRMISERTTEISDQIFLTQTNYGPGGSYIANIGQVTNKQDADLPANTCCQNFVCCHHFSMDSENADSEPSLQIGTFSVTKLQTLKVLLDSHSQVQIGVS